MFARDGCSIGGGGEKNNKKILKKKEKKKIENLEKKLKKRK